MRVDVVLTSSSDSCGIYALAIADALRDVSHDVQFFATGPEASAGRRIADLTWLICARDSRPPSLEGISGTDIICDFQDLEDVPPRYDAAVAQLTSGNADGGLRVVCGSDHARRCAILAGFPPTAVLCLRRPTELPPRDRAPSRHGPRRSAFVHVGELVPCEGPLATLEAFAMARRRVPGLALVFHGDGPLRDRLEERIARYELGDCVTIATESSDQDREEALATSIACCQHRIVMPDGQPWWSARSVPQAASLGTPAIATDCGSVCEDVVDGITGFLVPALDLQEMSNRMVELASDTRRWADLSDGAMRHARETRSYRPWADRIRCLADRAGGATQAARA